MPSFFLALIAAALATLAGREAVRVARLSAALGAGVALLTASWLASAIASVVAARLGTWLAAGILPETKTMLVVLALLLAAVETAVLRPGRVPAEPTRSFGAVLLVLGAAQLVSATGLVVLALASATGRTAEAATGGALGGGVVLAAAWAMGKRWETRVPLAPVRYGVAGLLLAAALAAGLPALGRA